MRRIELQNLLPAGTVTDRSRSEQWQELTSLSTGGSKTLTAGTGAGSGLETGGSSGAADLGGLLQGGAKDMTEQISALTSQITSLTSTQQSHIGATQDNTQAIAQNTSTKSSGSSVGSTVGGLASSLLGGGLSLSPIISGLISLFGGNDTPGITTQLPFRLPSPVQYDAGLSASAPGQAVPVSYGAGGQARTQAASPQVTVQVNTMDSRSFLDHSDEIANAVRQALLNSNALSDVISDL